MTHENPDVTTTYTADVTNPVTGDVVTLTAATDAELDRLVDDHLAAEFPAPTTSADAPGAGVRGPA